LVEQGVEETERGLSVLESPSVEKSYHTSEDGGRARSSIDLFECSGDLDKVSVTQSGDIGIGAVARVVRGSGRQSDSAGEVGVDGAVLPSGAGLVRSETSSGGDEGLRISADFLSLGQLSAFEFARVANGRQSGVVDDGIHLGGGKHGGSDGGDPRRVSGEDVGEGLLGSIAVGIVISGCSLISRSSQEGNTTGGDLVEFYVSAKNVLNSGGVGARDDLALRVIGPAPGHGDNPRSGGGGKQVIGEFEHPLVDGPEPDVGSAGDGTSILDIQSALGIRLATDVGSDDVGDIDSGLTSLGGEAGKILLVERSIRLEFSQAEGRVGSRNARFGDVVQLTQEVGIDHTGGDVVSDLGANSSAGEGSLGNSISPTTKSTIWVYRAGTVYDPRMIVRWVSSRV